MVAGVAPWPFDFAADTLAPLAEGWVGWTAEDFADLAADFETGLTDTLALIADLAVGFADGFVAGLAGDFAAEVAGAAPRGGDTLTDVLGVDLALAMDGMRWVRSLALLPGVV